MANRRDPASRQDQHAVDARAEPALGNEREIEGEWRKGVERDDKVVQQAPHEDRGHLGPRDPVINAVLPPQRNAQQRADQEACRAKGDQWAKSMSHARVGRWPPGLSIAGVNCVRIPRGRPTEGTIGSQSLSFVEGRPARAVVLGDEPLATGVADIDGVREART